MLKDISVRFDPVEDRLLLRLGLRAPSGNVDHWLHLTRRICTTWRGDLQAMLDLSADLPQRLDPNVRAMVSAANHQALAKQVPARLEATPGPPESVTPTLVTGVECGRRRSDGRWVFKFMLRDKASITVVLSGPTLHAFVAAVSDRVQGAAWGLAPMATERAQAAQSQPSTPLH